MHGMFYGILADIVGLVHFGYVAFVVVGLVLILIGIPLQWQWIRNPWFRHIHQAMILVVALESVGGIMCPLTTWESKLRVLAGQPEVGDSFVANLLNTIMFFDTDAEGEWLGIDHWAFKSGYVSFAALVIMTFFLAPPSRRRQGEAIPAPRRGYTTLVLLATSSFMLLYTALCMENYKAGWDEWRQEKYQEAVAKQSPGTTLAVPAKEDRTPVYFLASAGVICAVLTALSLLRLAPKGVRPLVVGFLISFAPPGADARGQAPTVFQELQPGVAHAHLVRSKGPLSIHVVRVARARNDLRWTTASGQDRVLSLGTVPAMAKAVSNRLGVKALAAINGDWFEIAQGKYQGDP